MSILIPTYFEGPVVEQRTDGKYYWTPLWQNFFLQLQNQLQMNFSNEGYSVPQQPSATIAALNTARSVGNILFDSDTNEFKGCVTSGPSGLYKTFTLT